MKISLKIFMVIFFTTILFAAANYLIYELELNPLAKSEALRVEEEIVRSDRIFNDLVMEESKASSLALDILATRQVFKNLYLQGDRQALYENSQDLFENLRQEHNFVEFYFLQLNDTVFFDPYNPEEYGQKMECVPLEKAKATNKIEIGLELEDDMLFTLTAVAPYYNGAQLIGYLEIDKGIDKILENFKKSEGDDIILLVEKQHINRELWAKAMAERGVRDSWEDMSDYALVGTTMKGEELSQEHAKSHEKTCFDPQLLKTVKDKVIVLGQFKEGISEAASCGGSPLIDASGKQIGVIVTHHDISKILSATNEAKKAMFLIILGGGLIIALAALFFVSRFVLKPLQKLSATITEISTGNLRAEIDPSLKEAQDEVGELAFGFERMLVSLKLAMRKVGSAKKDEEKEETAKQQQQLLDTGLITKEELKKVKK